MDEAFKDAEVVYPKSWGPFSLMMERVEANKSLNEAELKRIEKRCLELNAKYKNWKCDEEKMALTNNAKYMHCLPADINSEVSKNVFEKHKDFVYNQANKKPYIIMALLGLSLVKNLKKRLIGLQGEKIL
jgi:ornithine carbamoyltransferase